MPENFLKIGALFFSFDMLIIIEELIELSAYYIPTRLSSASCNWNNWLYNHGNTNSFWINEEEISKETIISALAKITAVINKIFITIFS